MGWVATFVERHTSDSLEDLKEYYIAYCDASDEEAAEGNWYGADLYQDKADILRCIAQERFGVTLKYSDKYAS